VHSTRVYLSLTIMTTDSDDIHRKQAILAGIPYTVTKQFPWKLHEMLELAEKEDFENIVSWLPSGRSFKVCMFASNMLQTADELNLTPFVLL
jgi:hypothetical protein